MSATLAEIHQAVGGQLVQLDSGQPADDVVIVDATHDSRQATVGWMFCAVPGAAVDGHDFATVALEAGASALLVERELDLSVPQLVVDDARFAMSHVACTVHRSPSSELIVVGVTGTNGKSSIVQLLVDICETDGRPSKMVGTLQGPRTTPESTDLQRLLREFADAGVQVVAMEVSSHALALHRVAGVEFACGIFTNLGRDHLDFHHTVDNYFEAKAQLFDEPLTRLGIVNIDDSYGRQLADRMTIDLVPYSLDDAGAVAYDGARSTFTWRGHVISLGLAGAYNVSNALGAATAAAAIGIAEDSIVTALGQTRPVRGRFEMVDGGQPFVVAVDYAHTPDALEAALVAARQVAGKSRVLVVFGCAGDRDAQKRPEMGQAAEKGADVVVVTSDNPRSEDPVQIIDGVLAGFDAPERAIVLADRRDAIERALSLAEPHDVVLIAGKGHETYQIVGDQTLDFDDRAVTLELLEAAT